jgi:MOSC domain-containing protein YiiM
MAQIISIVYQPEGRESNERQPDYLRIPLQEATLIAGYGIQGDQKGGHHPDRQLNLLSNEWLQKIGQQGYRNHPGEFGEQIIVQGLELEELVPGDRLQLGEEAVVEISKGRAGCDRLQAAQPLPVKELGSIGMLARVIRGGEIRTGDPVELIVESVNRQHQAAD